MKIRCQLSVFSGNTETKPIDFKKKKELFTQQLFLFKLSAEPVTSNKKKKKHGLALSSSTKTT